MSDLESVLSELESIGVVGDKVVLLKPKPSVEASEPPAARPASGSDPLVQFRETISKLSLKALKKLEGIAEEVQDLRNAFQELHEATTQGEADEEIQEEA